MIWYPTFEPMRITVSCLLCLFGFLSFGQSALTSGFFNYHLTDRYEIKSNELTTEFYSGIKPFRRDAVARFAKNLTPKSNQDNFNKNYLITDNIPFSEDPLDTKREFRKIYPQENSFFLVNEDRFKAVLNPVIGFSGAIVANDTSRLYQNSRGLELKGNIGNKVGFYSYALENQIRFPQFLNDKYDANGSVTGATLAKNFKDNGRDFFNVAGHVTFSPIEEITVQFGHDKNFIGNGYRSLILSNDAAPNTFLKLNTKAWKFNYMNLYSLHTDSKGFDGNAPTQRKYSALHHLSLNVGKNLTLGIWENVIFDRQDSLESDRFEVDYFNPLIFYRAVEHGLKSSDNVLLGMDWKWNFLSRFSFYGQFVLDEFIKDEFFNATSSWVNKWGYQAGLKYIDVGGINNLDAQLEINQVRPYVYSHYAPSQNWIHYNQSLAHPLGANFREIIGIIRYQPTNRLFIDARYSFSKQGIDTSKVTTNFGGDITRGNRNISNKNNVTLFQGIENTLSTISIDVSYMIWHNLFADAGLFIRNQKNPIIFDEQTTLFRLGLRLNLAAIDYRQ